ncbi:MAG: ABC transporter ATP-binding protein/permease [Oscillospiraceae bacterium]|nr:ABC transporter ATP-binding protein/permease [Oscillospiraceae bacterium]
MKTDRLTFKMYVSANLRALKLMGSTHPGYIAMYAASALCAAIQPLAVLAFSAMLLDELAGARDLTRIALYAALATVSTFALTAAWSALNRKINLGSFASGIMRTMMMRAEHYASLDFEHVEDAGLRELMTEISGAENWNGYGLGRMVFNVPQLFQNVLGLVASAVLLRGVFKAGLAVWPLALSPVVPVILSSLLARRGVKIAKENEKGMPKVNAMFNYYLGGYLLPEKAGKDIRIFNQVPAIKNILGQSGFRRFAMVLVKLESLRTSVLGLANSLIGAAAYIIIGLHALSGEFTIGQVTQYVGAIAAFSGAASGLAGTLSAFAENTPFLLKLYDFLDRPKVKREGTLPIEKNAGGRHELEFKNVSFRYPGAPDYALRNLDLKLRAGRKTAVVGMNGSGKTTMIKLLCRLYDPTEGEITLDGVDIREYDYRAYMDIFAVVFQDFKLTGFSLGQNVAASVDYDAGRVSRLLDTVGFGDKYPLDTTLYKVYDKDGAEVSGGEAQKIALARALYRDSPIMILDEPTAALDPLAESEIYSHFDGIAGDRTAVYISHRLSSCRFCDECAVFDSGTLVQHGTHAALLEDTSGKYHELWTSQAQYYK